MNRMIVVYQSKYGATEKYAHWIAQALHAPMAEKKKINQKQLSQFDTVIYGGGLYAGGVGGIDLITRNFEALSTKNLILFTCGLADPAQPENVKHIRQSLSKVLTPKMEEKIKVFHLRGGIDYAKLSVLHRVMMAMLYKTIKSRETASLTAEDRQMLEAYGKAVDYTDKNAIMPILSYVQNL